jgi:UMF1 family MFS transporter
LPPGENYLSVAIKQLRHTIRTASHFKEFLKYMAAFLIYNDGVIMALDFAAIIGAVLFGMDQEQLIIFVIIVQVTNVFGAYIFGHWADKYGGKRSLAISIVIMIAVIGLMYFAQTTLQFFFIGAAAGFAMAGTQSVSRTMVGAFSPKGKSAEFYGFFAVAGRTSSFLGPAVYGILAAEAALWFQAAGQSVQMAEQSGQRIAILSIGVFLLVGLILLTFVDEKKARRAANKPTAATPSSPLETS